MRLTNAFTRCLTKPFVSVTADEIAKLMREHAATWYYLGSLVQSLAMQGAGTLTAATPIGLNRVSPSTAIPKARATCHNVFFCIGCVLDETDTFEGAIGPAGVSTLKLRLQKKDILCSAEEKKKSGDESDDNSDDIDDGSNDCGSAMYLHALDRAKSHKGRLLVYMSLDRICRGVQELQQVADALDESNSKVFLSFLYSFF